MSLDKFNFVKKVDKEEGKGLSTNDYTNLDQVEVQNLRTNKTKAKQIQVEDRGSTPPNSPDVQTALENIFAYMQVLDPDEVLNIIQDLEMDISGKVDKIAGKGLSTEDFTTTEKNKLAGIAASANNYTHPATHPPTIIAQNATNRFMTDAEKTKLAGIAAGAQVNRTISSQAQAEAGTDNTTVITPLRAAQAIAKNQQWSKGSYTGDGNTSYRLITLGFKPSILFVVQNDYGTWEFFGVAFSTGVGAELGLMLAGNSGSVEFRGGPDLRDTGFAIAHNEGNSSQSLNRASREYTYYALKL